MPVVMGTAGHIDHGKTSLVRALTGIDCDRLEEEKRRGITIELGFAFCDLPGAGAEGGRLGIVDVPGHERFVKNMVAGASGIDFVMLVIAADEGVMPQTREHLEICSLLGIRHGLVALTKVDMVDADWLELARDDVAGFLAGTFLEGAPIFPVSSTTGHGLDALREHLVTLERELRPVRRSDLFRLPVDRVFTMKGHGTVVTGTMISGSVKVGDEVLLYPGGTATKVRGLQSHGGPVDVAPAGRRTAVNVQGLDVDEVQRGDVLAHPGTLFPSLRWMTRLTCLSSAPTPLKNRTEVHFHHGAREVLARLYFPDRDKLAPGETALCEVRFSEPMVGVAGDRCVVRSFSPLRTVAGGAVLHPLGLDLRRRDPDFADRLALLEGLPDVHEAGEAATQETATQSLLRLAGSAGARFAQLSVLTNLESKRLDKALQSLGAKGQVFCFDREERAYVDAETVRRLAAGCLARAAEFHAREPLKPGMARGALSAGWGRGLHPKLVHFIVERLLKSGELVAEGDVLRLPGHKVSLASDQEGLRATIRAAYAEGGSSPPNVKDVLDPLGLEFKEAAAVFKLLQDAGELVKVKDGLYYPGPVMADLKARVAAWFDTHDDLDPAGFKELSGGLSRKYVIPLLEYFDKERVTIRVGDKRQLRGR
ncbi:selenocysteine-specific translation elongation factor [Nitratidesulfovibrio sp. HK-II]|uniref:selenocysteine-specific translation elongation factor n=1 Tax=Nitratidesulfovibrio sp. HK-II TaxID=2009266 RepID=UPI000E2EA8FC|nr:selenocysteine-specific translation elongation factor [Nitratidesulfovibrio sp. HK-II]GBO96980.1 selenocysteine-specific translation elongation factor [Nitratidesulfovibrio sp. HK-II]